MKIKLQFMATQKETDIRPSDDVEVLKYKVETLFSIPASQQSLFLEERNISTASKKLDELGFGEGSLVRIRRINKISGACQEGGIGTLIRNPMVKNMLKNPGALKSIREMFPGMDEENSTLNMLMNSEGMGEELEKFAADDGYLDEQMRNADIRMAKLQNLPEGVQLMSSLAKDQQSMCPQAPVMNLRFGEALMKRNSRAIPGKSGVNYLVEYRGQLLVLKNIGFENVRENLEVLKRVNGDLESAQEILIRKYENKN